jgi:hypothetical protein
MKQDFEAKAPPEAVELMHSSTDELAKSGILDEVLKPGDLAPQFSLNDEQGNAVESSSLLHQGPLVLTFYRGVW